MRGKWLRRILILVALVAIVIALRLTVFRTQPVPVTVFRVAEGRVEDVVTNSKAGTVKTRRRAALSTEIGGLVAELPVREGDRVERGQVLLRLADADYRARAKLQRAFASTRSGRRGTRPAPTPSRPSGTSRATSGWRRRRSSPKSCSTRPEAAATSPSPPARGAGPGAGGRGRPGPGPGQPGQDGAARPLRRRRGRAIRRGGRVDHPLAARACRFRRWWRSWTTSRSTSALRWTRWMWTGSASARRCGSRWTPIPGRSSRAASPASRPTCWTSRSRTGPSRSRSSSTTRTFAAHAAARHLGRCRGDPGLGGRSAAHPQLRADRGQPRAGAARTACWSPRRSRPGCRTGSSPRSRAGWRRASRSWSRWTAPEVDRGGPGEVGRGDGPVIELRQISRTFQIGGPPVHALRVVRPGDPGRRLRLDHGPVRLGQVDAAEHPRLPGPARRRAPTCSTARRWPS